MSSGSNFRLASRPSGLRAAPAAPLAQRGLKNIHATLRAAAFNAPSGATFVWPQGRAICGLYPRRLGPKGLKNIHTALPAAGFGVPSGATFVWPQGRAICGLYPRYLGRKGAKKTFMQPCGLRDLACPRGRQSFGLKAKRFAGCARGALAQRGLKNIPATLPAARFGVPSGATFVWPQGRAICGLHPRYLGPKGAKKTFLQPCRLRHLTRPWKQLSFGLKAGQVAD